MKSEDQLSELYKVFGNYRAEWLRNRIYDFYREPKYFPQLLDPRPTVLRGGRGTGKTTVLRALSYEGQAALGRYEEKTSDRSFGIYYRVNTNRTTAFEGPDLSEKKWTVLFGHFLNLIIVEKVLKFVEWYGKNNPTGGMLEDLELEELSMMLLGVSVSTAAELNAGLSKSKINLQNFINNTDSKEPPFLSIQSAPIDKVFSVLKSKECFKEDNFFLLIDEYENLLDYQQRIINTLIKHSEADYTFKIGVKEFGFREKSTLNTSEKLTSPADYVLLDINDYRGSDFFNFAIEVCTDRLKSLFGRGEEGIDLKSYFPSLSIDEEARLLSNGSGRLGDARKAFSDKLEKGDLEQVLLLPDLLQYLIYFWSEKKKVSLRKTWLDYKQNKKSWATRYENYKYALLFTLSPKGASLKKYYCGVETFAQLAGGNIRYFMELIERSVVLSLRNENTGKLEISPKTQTMAAKEVGSKNLRELESMSIDGAKLSKIVHSLGRGFEILARDLKHKRPEVNQFCFNDGSEVDEVVHGKFSQLIRSGITDLAIVRYQGTKATSSRDPREYDYSIHPVFSALYSISTRRKRSLPISENEFVGFSESHSEALRKYLRRLDGKSADTADQLTLTSFQANED